MALETAPEFGTVPESILAEISAWIGICEPGSAGPPPVRTANRLSWDDSQICEEVLTLGKHRHIGVLSSPRDQDAVGATLVFLNPGSETHVGSGRAWVEYARDPRCAGTPQLAG